MAPAPTDDRPELDGDPRAWIVDPDLLAAFGEHERAQGSQRLEVGCYLTMILLPLGSIVDYFLYQSPGLRGSPWTGLRGPAILPLFLFGRSRTWRIGPWAFCWP
jgi:hypothetical protein